MKTAVLTLLTILFTVQVNGQIFHEDFEYVDSMFYSGTSGGWSSNDRIPVSGQYCDSATILNPGDIFYMTSMPFSTIGNDSLYLYFNHICKIEFFDIAQIQVSSNGGLTWNILNSTQYIGQAVIGIDGKFSEATYVDWQPGISSLPQLNWWKTEIFDVYTLLQNTTNALVRFKLADGNNSGGAGKSGWYLDDFSVDTTLRLSFLNTASMEEFSIDETKIKLYPVPAGNSITVEFNSDLKENVDIKIYSILGKVVDELPNHFIKNDANKISIDISELNQGIYFIGFSNQKSTNYKRIIKQ